MTDLPLGSRSGVVRSSCSRFVLKSHQCHSPGLLDRRRRRSTGIDGTVIHLDPRDVVVTPTERWHEHGNMSPTGALAIWQDCTNDPLVNALADLLNNPHVDALLVDGASLGTFYALAAARHRVQPQIRSVGASGCEPGRIYTSDQAHSSVDKAAIALGIGSSNVVRISTGLDSTFDAKRLAKQIDADLTAGYTPVAVVATVGTTTSGAIDPLTRIADICRQHELWLHVDAAYGGFWNSVPAIAKQLPALFPADSVVANPHKVLFTPMECGALFCLSGPGYDPEPSPEPARRRIRRTPN